MTSVPPEARNAAQAILGNRQLVAQLPADVANAIRMLLAPSPTPQQIQDGMAALAATIAALDAARQNALAQMLPSMLREWYLTPSWMASRQWLNAHIRQLPGDAPEQFEQAGLRARSRGDGSGADVLEMHAKLIREARRNNVDAAYQQLIGARAFSDTSPQAGGGPQPLIVRIEEWIKTDTWVKSRLYLQEHAAEMLVPETESLLQLLHNDQHDDRARQAVRQHQRIIQEARRVGVDAAYRSVIGQDAFQGSVSGASANNVEDVISLDQARSLAQEILRDPYQVSRLTPEARRDLQALLAPSPTPEQIRRGKIAAVTIAVVVGTEAVQRQLVEWINTPDWGQSRAFLKARRGELLTDAGELAMSVLISAAPDDRTRKICEDHAGILKECRRIGIDAAYDAFLRSNGSWA